MGELLEIRRRDGASYCSFLNATRNSRLSLLFSILFTLVTMMAARAGAATSKVAALHAVGLRTIQAVASGDAAYIASIVDAKGIYVGYGGVRHSAESFKHDVAQHVGLYCELFRRDCKTGHNPDYTLEHSLSSGGKPTNSDLKFKIEGNVGTVEYWEFGGEGDLIVTFSYRFANGKWNLYNIYYV